MEKLLKEFLYGIRLILKSPGLSLAAVLSLALGIGVNGTIFSVVNSILLSPLPVADSDRLVEVYYGDESLSTGPFSYPDFVDLKERNEVFSSVIGHNPLLVFYDAGDQAEVLLGEIVSADYFSVLGVPITRGRGFLPEEGQVRGAHPVVIVSHRFWSQRFSSDMGLIGRSLKLNGTQYTVVGVAPEEFHGVIPGLSAEVWIPMMMHDQARASDVGALEDRDERWFFVKGRLASGVEIEQAEAQMEVISQGLQQQYPDTNQDKKITLAATDDVALNPSFDGPLFGVAALLMVMVGSVLLIAMANIANLLLVRASGRRKEIAIRLAVGAGRPQIIRQFLIESIILALLAGVVSFFLVFGLVKFLVTYPLPASIPLSLSIDIDFRVALFTFLLSLAAGLLCGLMPAFRNSKPQLTSALKDDQSITVGAVRKLSFRNILVVAQVAISLFLLIAAGLFLRSLLQAVSLDPGFKVSGVSVATVEVGLAGYNEERGRAFYRELLERVQSFPGLRAASYTDRVPMGANTTIRKILAEGSTADVEEEGVDVDMSFVSPDFFKTLGIALISGRDFQKTEVDIEPKEAIVNETFAQRFWPDQDPINRRFSTAAETFQVVGVAGDSKYRSVGEETIPYFYLQFPQNYRATMSLLVDTDREPSEMLSVLRREIRGIDENLPISDLKTMEDHLSGALFAARVGAAFLATFGALGLFLAVIGVYGVVAYSVSLRTREIGIRQAIGARRIDIFKLVMKDGMMLVGVGLAVGLILALLMTRFLSSFLYGISPTDPLTFFGVISVLTLVSALACLIPARKVTRIHPNVVLRAQ